MIFAGSGGSAIGPEVVAAVARAAGGVTMEVLRGYTLPARLAPDTLVVACSFSGNTEETLAVFEEALRRDVMLLAFTTGGALAARAGETGTPLLTYDWPGPPRTALGYSVFTLLGVLARLGAVTVDARVVEDACAGLDDAVRDAAAADGLGARLAADIGDAIPLFAGADFLEVAARRWASEFNENAKRPAFALGIPELDHNLIEALAAHLADPHLPDGRPPAALLHGAELRPVFLDAPGLHPRNRVRIARTIEVVREAGYRPLLVDAGGATPLEAVLRSCAVGSFASYYLARARGVDPAATPALDAFKRRIAGDR